jgi:integrase
LTGQRRGEVVGMRWDEVDLERKVWSLPASRTKNKRAHELPLSSAATDILTSLPRIENKAGLVFPARASRGEKVGPVSAHSKAKVSLDRAIAELAEAEGSPPLAQFGLHDLRRSTASGMARLGVDLHVIERCLNHVSGSFGGIVGVYQKHKFEDGMRRAMDAWGAHVERLVTGAAAGNVVELAKVRA